MAKQAGTLVPKEGLLEHASLASMRVPVVFWMVLPSATVLSLVIKPALIRSFHKS